MRKYLFYIFVLIIAVSPVLKSQNVPVDTVTNFAGIEITTSVDKAEVYIGDLITYTLTIVYDSTLELVPPPLGANLGAFDVKDYQPDQITKLDDGKIKSVNTFVLSTFTTGEYIIPPMPVIFTLPDKSKKLMLSEGVPINVQSLMFNVDDTTDIRPLKAQIDSERFEEPKTTLYLMILGSLILLGGIIFFIWYKWFKKKSEGDFIDNRTPWEKALEELALLKQQKFIENKMYKEFYLSLTEIIRVYLGRMYNKNFIDMTTEEFIISFETVDAPAGVEQNLKELLKHADLVKFAKMIPLAERPDSDYDLIYKIIDDVKIDYERKQQAVVEIKTSSTSSNSEIAADSADEPDPKPNKEEVE